VAGDIRVLVGVPRGDAPILVHCPFHDDLDESYAVYADGGFCFGCRRKESREEFVARLGANLDALPEVQEVRDTRGVVQDPRSLRLALDTWHQLLFDPIRHHRIDYLESRGLWPETIKAARLGHTGDRFSIPVIEAHTYLGYQLRIDPPYSYIDEVKYLNPRGQQPLIYRPNPEGSRIVVCEGPLDALLLAQYGYDAVTTTGGAGTLGQVLVPVFRYWKGPEISIATDVDEAGETASRELLAGIKNSARLFWAEGKDITDALLRVPAIKRGRWLRELIGA
jgi:DNA primase